MSSEQPAAAASDRDLGFGAIVARESRQRLLNRDGSFNVRRRGLGFGPSMGLYHAALTMRWTTFFLVLAGAFLAVNAGFAAAYLACGPGALVGGITGVASGGFLEAFFFSVQTFSTIGYGQVTAAGTAANLLVTAEALVALLVFALATGLTFSRFSRPRTRIDFSDRAIIAPYAGGRAFEFRIVNRRSSQIIELSAQVLFSRFEGNGDAAVRRFYPLALERTRVTFFPLSWTIVHPIDERSPLAGLTAQDLEAAGAEFLILLTGFDETLSEIVYARSSYRADEVVWGAKFADIFEHGREGRGMAIRVDRLSSIERVGLGE
jgi:inward rectifier potassium channel